MGLRKIQFKEGLLQTAASRLYRHCFTGTSIILCSVGFRSVTSEPVSYNKLTSLYQPKPSQVFKKKNHWTVTTVSRTTWLSFAGLVPQPPSNCQDNIYGKICTQKQRWTQHSESSISLSGGVSVQSKNTDRCTITISVYISTAILLSCIIFNIDVSQYSSRTDQGGQESSQTFNNLHTLTIFYIHIYIIFTNH